MSHKPKVEMINISNTTGIQIIWEKVSTGSNSTEARVNSAYWKNTTNKELSNSSSGLFYY